MKALTRTARPPASSVPVQVYTPQRMQLPRLRSYLSDLWTRRHFALHLIRSQLRAQQSGTVFGQLWLVLNPLLLALMYYVLITILRERQSGIDFLAHLTACVFAFHLVSTSVNSSAKSVVRSGKLILNTAFPRSLLPIAAVLTATARFLPTMLVYAVVHAVAGLPVGPHLLWALVVFAELVVFALGVGLAVSVLQVYFRDLSNFLPYVTRLWLYSSPVLYFVDQVPDGVKPLLAWNPLVPMLAAWSQVLHDGRAPDTGYLLQGAVWAVAALVLGGLFFVSREREFAVRL